MSPRRCAKPWRGWQSIIIDHALSVTVSGGLATIEPNERVETLIQRADSALYAAKAAGRNCAFAPQRYRLPFWRTASGSSEAAWARTARLVELINSPDAHKPPVDDASDGQSMEFGTFCRAKRSRRIWPKPARSCGNFWKNACAPAGDPSDRRINRAA